MTIHYLHKRHVALFLIVAMIVFALTGCGSLSGLDGTSEYGCKAPVGVKCDSVSGNYYNALQNNLPSQRRQSSPLGEGVSLTPGSSAGSMLGSVATQRADLSAAMPMALRAQARVLRIWIKPWEDVDRDLNDQAYVYVQVDGGHWLIEHAQRQVRDAYTPIRPPRNRAVGVSQSDTQPAVSRPSAVETTDAQDPSITKTLDAQQDRSRFASGDERK